MNLSYTTVFHLVNEGLGYRPGQHPGTKIWEITSTKVSYPWKGGGVQLKAQGFDLLWICLFIPHPKDP